MMDVLATIAKSFFMAVKFLLMLVWKAIVGIFGLFKSKKPEFKTTDATNEVQALAATKLPELNLKHDKLFAEKLKLQGKLGTIETELKLIQGAIKVATGDFGQHAKPNNGNNNNNKNGKNKNNNGNNNNQQAIQSN